MMRICRNETNCSSCDVFDQCFVICCPVAHLCRDCMLADNLLNELYVCSMCGRELRGLYRIFIDQAQL